MVKSDSNIHAKLKPKMGQTQNGWTNRGKVKLNGLIRGEVENENIFPNGGVLL